MRVLRIIFVALFVFIAHHSDSQIKVGKHEYPHLSKSTVNDQWIMLNPRHVLALPGVWGLGLQAEVLKPWLIYASAEAGFGWVIGKHEEEFDKKWRPWWEVQVGYPLFNLPSKGRGRWVISQANIGDKTYENFYRIDVPRYHALIPFVEYRSTPTNAKITPIDPGPVAWYSFNAPVIGAGLKYTVRARGEARVRDSKTGELHTGPIQTRFEMYFAINKSIGNPHLTPEGYRSMYQVADWGYELMFKIPVGKLNAIGTFDIGIRSLGVNAKKAEQSAQLYLGNTFYF